MWLYARLLSVTSKVIPAITSPPCTKHEEDDAEDYDDDRLLSVTSKVIPAITSPPCTKHEEDDTEDYDDDNNALKWVESFCPQNFLMSLADIGVIIF